MKEIWNLKGFLEFALLERIVHLAEHLEDQLCSRSNVATLKSSGRLHKCVESVRRVFNLEWKTVFEDIDATEKILKTDPLGAYERMDFEGRDAYRAAVGDMAARSDSSEHEIAREAISLAQQSQRASGLSERAQERRAHVGYYLIGPGQETLKQLIGYRSRIWDKIRRVASPGHFYFVSIALGALALALSGLALLDARHPAIWVFAILFLVAMECAVAITNTVVTSLLRPKKLPKLDFSNAIPTDCATIVVVPTLLTSESQVKKAVKDLEIRFLANRDPNLHFALLTDPADSKEQVDEKDVLAGLCSGMIEQLNKNYAGKKNGLFFHFHRSRTFNSRENLWMGWERKRGKLLQFNRFLLGQEDAFQVKTGELSLLSNIQYVITLDADTDLPAGTAHRLVGAIAHPLNSAVIDCVSNTVVEGYGILQPRVEISARSAQRSRLASLFSGETGLDIYTRAVSDVYQDLFGEAIFNGKGIYEVEAFQKVLDHRFPCDAVLSHDLIEGAHARAGLLSDVEVVDDYPSSYSALNRRKHRWIRGDWQISPWLFSRVRDSRGGFVENPISHVSRWKILDNLRRSVTDIAVFAGLLYAWFAVPQSVVRWTLVLLGILFLPFYARMSMEIVLNPRSALLSRQFWKRLYTEWACNHARTFLRLAFLCHQVLISSDAVIRTILRMKVTRRHMLEWETAADAEAATRGEHVVDNHLRVSTLVAVTAGVVLAIFCPSALPVAFAFLALWATLPIINRWLDRPSGTGRPALNSGEQALIRNAGLRTWRFFREFSNAEENWLVPDLLQKTPARVAHKISTTNLGLLLNARLAAYDMGYFSSGEFVAIMEKTFETIDRMPKYNGQLYNWYSTHTLKPEEPLFVSTVDNGNLLCSLWTLKEGCSEITSQPILRPVDWQGIQDHIDLLSEIVESEPGCEGLCPSAQDLIQRVRELSGAPTDAFESAKALEIDTTIFLQKLAECTATEEIRWWASELECRVKIQLATVRDFAPWLLPEYGVIREQVGIASFLRLSDLNLASSSKAYVDLQRAVRRVANSSEVPNPVRALAARLLVDVERSAVFAKNLQDRLSLLAVRARRLADEMDFSMFFDAKREMLSIGYDVGKGCISTWHYDLLPSEARSAAFVGIAQGTIPHKMWFRLGRFQGTHNREPLLCSWSGTMFEYLMPCLWAKTPRNSLLNQSARAAIRVQQQFADANGDIPWGVSECSCNEYEPDGHHVYHAFGVPKLALHRDEYSNDIVIAPYATFLAMMFEPVAAVQNLTKMKSLGWLGAYGFYDAADFTARRVPRGKQHEVVRTWMAHHQGMTLVAISNALCDSAMQRRFHADSRVAAVERVLHEKPSRVPASWEREIVSAFQPGATSGDTAKSAA